MTKREKASEKPEGRFFRQATEILCLSVPKMLSAR
jgi:hypothetical protein